MGVYWTFRQFKKKKKKGFLSIWVLICIILAKCDIYAQFIAFKCIVQWIQGFQKRKLGLKNSWNKYDTAAGLEGIYTCSMLHLEPHLIQSCRVRMKHFFPAALLHCLNILYVLYIDVNSVVLQSGLSAILWHSWRCNGVARGDGGQKHLCIVWD